MLPFRDRRLGRITLAIFFLLLLGYAYYEARPMLYGPQIEVPDSAVTVHEPFTEIRGQARYISELRLNGAVVTVTEDGMFEEPYMLSVGENHIVLDARDKFGRTRQKTIDVFYAPDERTDGLTPDIPESVSTSTAATSTPASDN